MSVIKFIKDYLALIVLIAPIIGGIWQILELSQMSMSYIRFFSITQLIADGILIITVFFPWIIGNMIYVFLYTKFNLNDYIFDYFNKLIKIFISVILSATVFLLLYKLWYIFTKIVTDIDTNLYIEYFSLVLFIYLMFFIITLILKQFLNKWMVELISIIIISFPTTLILILFLLFFHDIFFIPKNLENIKSLPSGNIQYWNDKYIFIEQKEQDDKKILVVKFDDLFKE